MSDLLDLFRRSSEPEDEGKQAKKKPKRKAKAKSTAGSRKKPRKQTAARASDETVLTLSRRQMLYAGSGQVILLGLAFLVGLTFGKGNSLERQTSISPPELKIYVTAQLPPTDGLGNQRPIDIRQIKRTLARIHEVDPDMIFHRKTSSGYELAIGYFPSIAAAEAFVDAKRLGQFRAAGRLPFQKPMIGPIKP